MWAYFYAVFELRIIYLSTAERGVAKIEIISQQPNGNLKITDTTYDISVIQLVVHQMPYTFFRFSYLAVCTTRSHMYVHCVCRVCRVCNQRRKIATC